MMRKATIVVLVTLAARVAQACHHPQNLLPFCGFDADLSGWDVLKGEWQWDSEPGPSGEAGSANGSAQVGDAELRSSCFAVSPNTTYAFGADSRAIAQGTFTECFVYATAYADTSCGSPIVFGSAGFPSPLPSVWTQTGATLTTPAGTGSARMILSCSSFPLIIALFDDVFFGEGLVPVELQTLSVE